MSSDEVDAVAAAVARFPGATAEQLCAHLRSGGMVSITTADVLRVLRGNERRFANDRSGPPRWRPARASEEGPAPDEPTRTPPPPYSSPVPPSSPVPAGVGDGPHADARARRDRGPMLYAWQVEALEAWRRQGGRGVVEAVTGTGKTMVGVAASRDELVSGGQVCVVVPTRELLAQWHGQLVRLLPASASVGRLGDGHRDSLGRHDALVAVVNSARAGDLRPRRPGGLLVADECHRYGTAGNRLALEDRFVRRLGLSATYARADDGHLAWLDPYFGPTCYQMGYRRAIADGVTARVIVALLGVRFSPDEMSEYDELTHLMRTGRARLIGRGSVPAEPVGAFLEAVARLARRGHDDEDAAVARGYLRAMQDRRRLLAETPAKSDLLRSLVPALVGADRTIVFTQSIAAAERAASVLRDEGVRCDALHSGLAVDRRRETLSRFARGALDAVAAPQVLDEGVDVPEADLAIVLASSRSRRQMIQRMGRVLRRKPDARRARFAVVYVEGTVEDLAWGAHETFLEEVTGVADSVETFADARSAQQACDFLCRTHG